MSNKINIVPMNVTDNRWNHDKGIKLDKIFFRGLMLLHFYID